MRVPCAIELLEPAENGIRQMVGIPPVYLDNENNPETSTLNTKYRTKPKTATAATQAAKLGWFETRL